MDAIVFVFMKVKLMSLYCNMKWFVDNSIFKKLLEMLGLHFSDFQVKCCQHSQWIKDHIYQLILDPPLALVFTIPK